MDWYKVIQYFRDECDASLREEVEAYYFSRETGILTFDNQSLEDAAKVLSHHFSRAVDVQPGLRDRTITVTFNNQPLPEILKILELTLHIGIDSTNEKIVLINESPIQ